MSVRVSHSVSSPSVERPAAPHLDVLTSGSERPPWLVRRLAGRGRLLAGAAGMAAALVAALSLVEEPDLPGAAQTPDPVRFALHPDSLVVPRLVPPAPGRAAVAGVHVELINTGTRTVVLRSASLVPGRWQVEITDRHQLRSGWSVVLDLHREVDCAPGVDSGPVPGTLVLEAEVDGRLLVRTVDVGPDQVAYGGQLDDLLSSPLEACAREAGLPLPGPIGDLFPARTHTPAGS